MQCVALRCSVLQCVAVSMSVEDSCELRAIKSSLYVCVNVAMLQCDALCCSVLQCVAVCYS